MKKCQVALKTNTNTLELYLDKKDREKLLILAKEMYKQKEYKRLRKGMEERRQEVSEGKVLTHEEIWIKNVHSKDSA